ncbi:MAG: alpha/beta hydrolase [Kofleriaceae bacterium]|nr:alpha/beta hydrolase [Kofleriaceae bacterium]
MTQLRYGSIVRSLWSLRGAPAVEELKPTRTVSYRAHRPGIAPLADIYEPVRPIGTSVLLVHGGGFVIGSRDMKPMRFLAAKLVAEGLTVCAVDYRMIFRGGRLDEAVADVRDALAFWRAHAPDASRIAMVGLSAGASIALLAADAALHRLVLCFGLYDMDHLQGPLASLLPRMLFATSDRAVWRERSPGAAHPAVPTLLLHGDDDGLVPVEQARRLAAAREVLGLPTRLVVYPGAPHGFFNLEGSVAGAATAEIVDYVR